jgi:hypothetical protein
MLFICEFEVLEGHPPKHDHAIIEANSRGHAFEKILHAVRADPDIDAVFLYEVPREKEANIPGDLIDKRMTKFVAENVMTDCGIALSYAARAILAKFPGPVTFQPSKLKWAGVFLMGLIGAGLGIFPMLLDPPGGWDLGMYFCVGFFLICGGFCMVGAVIMLIKGRITLDAAGFEVRSWVRRRRDWKDVRGFGTGSVGIINTVVYADSTRSGFWAEVNRRFLGGPNAYLGDTFGFAAHELAMLMHAWRRCALSQKQ